MTKEEKIKAAEIKFKHSSVLFTLEKAKIEHNNGWIKIESESDLPKETIECRTCFYDGVNYILGNTGERNAKQLWNSYKSIQITHYQPIEKPKPPIY